MPENIAHEMLRILPSHRSWTRDQLMAGTRRRCLAGARLRTQGFLGFLREGECNLAPLNHDPYTQLLARIIREQFPERAWRDLSGQTRETPVRHVISFNDHPNTRFADVRMVLEKAAVEWGERDD